MITKVNLLLSFIIIFLNIDSIETICIPGENCPINQGICSKSQCICLYGYKTLLNDENTQGNQIYCNYHQINRLTPLLIEFFFPSIGLLYMGRIVHGLIKLLCIIVLILSKMKIVSANIFTGLVSLTFLILYPLDLILISFGVYRDGNGMPLL